MHAGKPALSATETDVRWLHIRGCYVQLWAQFLFPNWGFFTTDYLNNLQVCGANTIMLPLLIEEPPRAQQDV